MESMMKNFVPLLVILVLCFITGQSTESIEIRKLQAFEKLIRFCVLHQKECEKFKGNYERSDEIKDSMYGKYPSLLQQLARFDKNAKSAAASSSVTDQEKREIRFKYPELIKQLANFETMKKQNGENKMAATDDYYKEQDTILDDISNQEKRGMRFKYTDLIKILAQERKNQNGGNKMAADDNYHKEQDTMMETNF